MNKYDQLVKQAENYLKKSRACCTCKNATEIIEKDCFQVKYYCNVYNKDVTKHCELMCKNYTEK